MRKKWLKIGVFVILLSWMMMNLNMGINTRKGESSLKMTNLEALAAPESGGGNPYYPCVKAKGCCLLGGLDIEGITLILE